MRTSKLLALFLLIAGLGGVTLKAQVLTVKSVGSVRHGADTQVTIVFSEPVEPASATTLANYTFTGGVTVSAASLMTGLPAADLQGNVENPAPTGRVQNNECVVLTVNGLAPGAAASITIQNVKDVLVPQNTVPTTTINFTDSGYTWGDTGTPTLDGRVIAIGTNGFDIFSAGSAQWGNYDEVTLVYKQTAGDFDYKARVEFQDFSSQWARAGIMAREVLNFGENEATQNTTASRYVDMHANPVMSWDSGGTGGFINANNGFESHFRSGATLNGDARGTDATGAGTPVYPNAWVRIVRQTNTFTTYRGTDGQNWTLQVTRNTGDASWTTPMANSIFLGPGFGVETGNINGSNPSAAFNRRYLYQVRSEFKMAG